MIEDIVRVVLATTYFDYFDSESYGQQAKPNEYKRSLDRKIQPDNTLLNSEIVSILKNVKVPSNNIITANY